MQLYGKCHFTLKLLIQRMGDQNQEEQNKRARTFMLSDFQVECIQHYFNHYDWELEEIDTSVLQAPSASSNDGNDVPVQNLASENHPSQPQSNPSPNNINDEDSFSDDEDGQCSNCFLKPCIATVTHSWLGNGQVARKQNIAIRKARYKKFWQVMHYKSAWKKKRYLRKKAVMMRRSEVDQRVVVHQREVMPDCVLDLVRGLYPNPPGIPYVGHNFW